MDGTRQQQTRALGVIFAGAALLVPQLATAQLYLNTQRSEPFVPIASIPGITNVTTLTFIEGGFNEPRDEGYAAVTLPFTFNFLGTNMTQGRLQANGLLTLSGPAPAVPDTADFINVAVGSATAPNNFIAPIWDDLIHGTNNDARSGVIGTAPNRIFVVEGGPATRYFGSGGTLFYQIWLYEGPGNKFEYRASGNPINTLNGTIGYEGANGTPSFDALGCGANCASGFDGVVFSTFIANDPELTGSVVTFPRGALPGEMASVDVQLRNLGVDTATSVMATLFLSTNTTLDGSDIQIGMVGPASVPGGNVPVPLAATITVPPGTAAADYYILLEVDTGNAYPENNETDNVVASATRFATAYDLRPSQIALVGALGGNPGDPLTFGVTIATEGVPYAGNADVEILLSRDQIVDGNDTSLGVVSVSLTGTANEVVNVTRTLPLSLQSGTYYPVARLDGTAMIAELSDNNNTYVSPTSFQVGYDFNIASITVPAQIAPGTAGTITTRIASLAAPYNGSVSYRLYASLDTTLDSMDTDLGSFSVTFAAEGSRDDAQSVTPPALPAGSYYVIGEVDPGNAIREVSETNNQTASSGRFANAVDFAVGPVTFTPSTVEAGDTVTVMSSILSLGLQHTGNVPYRVYFSPDNQFDLADEPVYNGSVFVAGLNTTPLSAPVIIPNSIQVRTFNVIVVVDAANVTPESNEDNNWTSSSATLSIRGADLEVTSLVNPGSVFIGLPFDVQITLRNDGQASARNFRYAYYLSENEIIRVTDMQIGISQSATIAAGQSQTFNDTLMLPTFTATQTMWLGVIVDIYSNVPETSEGNNIAKSEGPISIVFPIPNLRAQIVETATAAAAGEQLAITRVLLNDGVFDAPAFDYAYYLSSNPTVSTDDILIGSFSSGLGTGEDDFTFDILQIPSDVPAGTYYLGLIVDPEDLVDEVDETDNVVVGPQIPVYSAAIQFLTQSLPDATLGSLYQVGVYASGGPVGITWAVRSGALPMGITLDPATGIISGTPTEEGIFTFVLRAMSGTAYADREFTMRVLSPTVPLRIVSTTLQSGVAGREYSTRLIAVGGTVPYEWSAISTLPAGLELAADGSLTGVPTAPGNIRLTVRVRDAIGASASKELALNIISPNQKLVITQIVLPTAVVDTDYCGQDVITFEAMGGISPYTWSVVGEPVPGMTLAADGVFCGTPEQTGSFALTVRVQDQTGLVDTSLFILDVDDGRELAISTFTLQAGTVSVAYDATITAVRGDPPYEWSLVPGTGELPPGLALNTMNGHVTGTPSQAGIFAFTVQVIDAKKRTDVQPLSIEIAEPAGNMMTDDGGCSCSGVEDRSSAAWSALLLLAFAFAGACKRRR